MKTGFQLPKTVSLEPSEPALHILQGDISRVEDCFLQGWLNSGLIQVYVELREQYKENPIVVYLWYTEVTPRPPTFEIKAGCVRDDSSARYTQAEAEALQLYRDKSLSAQATRNGAAIHVLRPIFLRLWTYEEHPDRPLFLGPELVGKLAPPMVLLKPGTLKIIPLPCGVEVPASEIQIDTESYEYVLRRLYSAARAPHVELV